MGYLGFGLKEKLYRRKPKKSFEKARKMYGSMMENSATPSGESLKDHYHELEALREQRRSKGKLRSMIFNSIAFLGFLFLIYMIFQWMGGKIS